MANRDIRIKVAKHTRHADWMAYVSIKFLYLKPYPLEQITHETDIQIPGKLGITSKEREREKKLQAPKQFISTYEHQITRTA